jgi:sporulation protein YabP
LGVYGLEHKDDHDIHIRGRKAIEVTGVSSVESFDVNEFSLMTSAGPLALHGNNLHMKHLDLQTGVVIIEGTVTRIEYVAERARKKKLTGKLFR